MKRFTLATVVAAAVVVGISATALAGNTTYKLAPRDSDYPDASGLITWSVSGPDWYWGFSYRGKVKIYYGWGLTITADFSGLAANTGYTVYYVYTDPTAYEWFQFDTNGTGAYSTVWTTTIQTKTPPAPPAVYVTDVNGVVVLSSQP